MEITFTDGKAPGSAIVSEANNWRSRDTVTYAASQDIKPNDVLAKNGSGQFIKVAPAASDGTQTPAGVAIYPIKTGVGQTVKGAALVRDAEVHAGLLGYNGANSSQITALRNGLKTLGIIPRIDVKEAIS